MDSNLRTNLSMLRAMVWFSAFCLLLMSFANPAAFGVSWLGTAGRETLEGGVFVSYYIAACMACGLVMMAMAELSSTIQWVDDEDDLADQLELKRPV